MLNKRLHIGCSMTDLIRCDRGDLSIEKPIPTIIDVVAQGIYHLSAPVECNLCDWKSFDVVLCGFSNSCGVGRKGDVTDAQSVKTNLQLRCIGLIRDMHDRPIPFFWLPLFNCRDMPCSGDSRASRTGGSRCIGRFWRLECRDRRHGNRTLPAGRPPGKALSSSCKPRASETRKQAKNVTQRVMEASM